MASVSYYALYVCMDDECQFHCFLLHCFLLHYLLCTYLRIVPGVVIVSNPAGTPVDGQLNTVSYPILSSVSLTCMLVNGVTEAATYQWDTTGCYTNTAYNRGNPNCFPVGETAQTVTGIDLNAEDAGTIHCTITIGDVHYTSSPLTLHISGESLITQYKEFY